MKQDKTKQSKVFNTIAIIQKSRYIHILKSSIENINNMICIVKYASIWDIDQEGVIFYYQTQLNIIIRSILLFEQ